MTFAPKDSPFATLARRLLHLAVRPLSAVATVVGAGLVAAGCARPTLPPDEVEVFGEIELVTHYRAELGGDGARFAWQTVSHWTMRWQGRPVVFDSLGGMFGDQPIQAEVINAVFVLEAGTSTPTFVVNVGDPNNTSAFHQVRVDGGRLDARLLCVAPSGDNGVSWAVPLTVDAARGDAAVGGAKPWLEGPRRDTLRLGAEGAIERRHLMLGQRCVFDAIDGIAYALPQPAGDVSIARWSAALVSPAGTRIARLATIPRGSATSAGIWVSDRIRLPEGLAIGTAGAWMWQDAQSSGWNAQQLVIDRRRMRYPTLHAIDAGFVRHHFMWTMDDGRERLVERPDYTPLPHRGAALEGHHEYRIEGAPEQTRRFLVDLLVAAFGGAVDAAAVDDYSTGVVVEGQRVEVTDRGFYFDPTPSTATAESRDALFVRMAAAIDAELAGGRLTPVFDEDRDGDP